MVIKFLEALWHSAYFSLVGFREKNPLGKGMYQLKEFCTYFRTYHHLKWNFIEVWLRSSLHYFQGVQEYFWIAEVCSNNVRLYPNYWAPEFLESKSFRSFSGALQSRISVFNLRMVDFFKDACASVNCVLRRFRLFMSPIIRCIVCAAQV